MNVTVWMQFNMSFYMTYLARWPDYFHVAVAPGHHTMGYSSVNAFLTLLLSVPSQIG
jgi:hypothetical protein